MYSFESKLDRDVARSFLHAPTDSISYRPMNMRENLDDEDFIPRPHPNAQLACPTNTSVIPLYYDVIIDTVTDYDIFYPIAKQTKKYYTQRSDEFAVSIDFPNDYSYENESIQYQDIQASMKNVRFNDNPAWIPQQQHSFHPEIQSQINHQSTPTRYITTPFFWFRPVLNNNYAICIPTSRPSLHAYITTAYDPKELSSTPNPVRL